ncbi:MAG: 1-acyl-sn-glycerol-3-phosphate acyltransferase, partial [Planctomycetaceae bacterium]
MQRIVIDEPYEFVPPSRQTLISTLFKPWLPGIIRKRYGIVEYRYSGIEALKQSLADGDGIILCPNHSRDSDPMLMGMVCREARCHIYSMASWHVFK